MSRPSPRTPAFEAAMVGIEWLSLFLFGGLWVALAYSMVTGAVSLDVQPVLGLALLLGLVVPLGFVVADMVTGFGHYFADNFCSERTFLIGHALVFRFRQHHDHPRIICSLGFRELNGGLAGLSVPWLVLGLWLASLSSTWGLLAAAVCWSSAFFMAATNQIHRWAHERAPRWVRWLQKHDLILSPQRHAVHHKAPHDVHFCISCGWCNTMLDELGVWHRMADVLAFLGVPQADESVMGTKRQRALSARPDAAGSEYG